MPNKRPRSSVSIATPDSDAGAGPSNPGLLWWKKAPAKLSQQRSGHPYVLKDVVKTKGTAWETFGVAFCHLAGSEWERRLGSPGIWDKWRDCCAITRGSKVVFASCCVKKPWDVMFTIELSNPSDDGQLPWMSLFSVAWSFHPLTLHPIVAVAGADRLVYVIDVETREIIRVLRGHGDEIFSLAFNPLHPHILASTSVDRTTRIWNILGTNPPPLPEGVKRDENFPQGDADEGTVLVAILASGVDHRGGHRNPVVGCAFHPRHRAIATVGLDGVAAIWALPPFPDPKPTPAPPNYRAHIVYHPIFSTSLLHRIPQLGSVAWLSNDTLITRAPTQIITWRWLGFPRYFSPGSYAARSTVPEVYDYTDSLGFQVLGKYEFVEPIADYYTRFALWQPPLDGSDSDSRYPLLAFCPDVVARYPNGARRFDYAPRLLLWNPLHCTPPEDPFVLRKRHDPIAGFVEMGLTDHLIDVEPTATTPAEATTLVDTPFTAPSTPDTVVSDLTAEKSIIDLCSNIDTEYDVPTPGSMRSDEPASVSERARRGQHAAIRPSAAGDQMPRGYKRKNVEDKMTAAAAAAGWPWILDTAHGVKAEVGRPKIVVPRQYPVQLFATAFSSDAKWIVSVAAEAIFVWRAEV